MRSVRIAAVVALCAGAAACSSSSSPAAESTAPAVTSTPTPSVEPVTPGQGVIATPTLSAADVADTGLPSHIGSGKLPVAKVKQLMQYFEDKVSAAYANGDVDALDHYLAGPMLSGNRATINVLNQQHKLNVFRINVQSVSLQTNEAHHLIFDMTGDMVLDYFVDAQTHKVLNNGLPGPSQVQFAVFLDENPSNHTWYWTGEQSETAGGNTGSSNTGSNQ